MFLPGPSHIGEKHHKIKEFLLH